MFLEVFFTNFLFAVVVLVVVAILDSRCNITLSKSGVNALFSAVIGMLGVNVLLYAAATSTELPTEVVGFLLVFGAVFVWLIPGAFLADGRMRSWCPYAVLGFFVPLFLKDGTAAPTDGGATFSKGSSAAAAEIRPSLVRVPREPPRGYDRVDDRVV